MVSIKTNVSFFILDTFIAKWLIFFSNADKSMRNEWEGLCKARPGCPSPTVLNPDASKK